MCKLREILRKNFLNHLVFLLILSVILMVIITVWYFFPTINIWKFFLKPDMWGAFFGAGFAFILNCLYEKQRVKRENCQILIKEHFKLQVLYKQLNQIKNHVEKCQKNALKQKKKYGISDKDWELIEWQFIKIYLTSFSPPFSKSSLDFMLEKERLECLTAILLATDQYEKSLSILQKRNELYDSYLAKSQNLDDKDCLPFEVLKEQAGEKLVSENRHITRALLETLSESTEDTRSAFIKTGEFIKITWNKEPLSLS